MSIMASEAVQLLHWIPELYRIGEDLVIAGRTGVSDWKIHSRVVLKTDYCTIGCEIVDKIWRILKRQYALTFNFDTVCVP